MFSTERNINPVTFPTPERVHEIESSVDSKDKLSLKTTHTNNKLVLKPADLSDHHGKKIGIVMIKDESQPHPVY